MFSIFRFFHRQRTDELDQVVDLLNSVKLDLARLMAAMEKAQRPALAAATIAAGALYVAYLLNGGVR